MAGGHLSIGRERFELRNSSSAYLDIRCRMAAQARGKVVGNHIDAGTHARNSLPPKRSPDFGTGPRTRGQNLAIFRSDGGGGTVGNR